MSKESAWDNIVGVGLLLKAVQFSAEKHQGQKRKGADASPYINHPIEVAAMLANVADVQDLTILIAAVLHDTIEDTHTSPEDLEALFGAAVCSLVQEVSDDKRLPKSERKRLQIEHAPRLSEQAKLIKLADKSANVGDVSDRPPSDWTIERRQQYLDWAEQVVTGCRGVNRALEAHFDQTLMRAREVVQGKA